MEPAKLVFELSQNSITGYVQVLSHLIVDLASEEDMKEHVRNGVMLSLRRLVEEDGHLFECPIEEDAPYDARKLHEVCINHRLANHFETEIVPLVRTEQSIFVDVEFNREGLDSKSAMVDGEEKTVRPDIIIHNRRTGKEKLNFLVVECKKADAPTKEIERDCGKVRALMSDPKYDYSFGLQVLYGDVVRAKLFFKSDDAILEEALAYPTQSE